MGDELGSRVVTARLVREVMHLGFLLEQQYLPYSKWLGTAFARLRCAPALEPALLGALAATDWPERERYLSVAYETVARLHNALGLTDWLPDAVSPFYGRPVQVIHGDRFAAALQAAISDEAVKRLPRWLGNTTQWADSTDVLSNPRWVPPLPGAVRRARCSSGMTEFVIAIGAGLIVLIGPPGGESSFVRRGLAARRPAR